MERRADNDKLWAFVSAHADDDIHQLALKAARTDAFDLNEALEQIAGRQAAKRKLPSWAGRDGIVYPPHLSMEQCSSEQTALYKAAIAERVLMMGGDEGGWTVPAATKAVPLLDLTGGFGVDFVFMAQAIGRHADDSREPTGTPYARPVYVERQSQLCAISSTNFPILHVDADIVCEDATIYLQQTGQHFRLIYMDPARRDSHGARTYGIGDCTPNVLTLLDLLTEKADHILLKLSPMLDWRKAVSDIGINRVSEIHIVSVSNECKELLLLIKGGGVQEPGFRVQDAGSVHQQRLFCVNDGQVFQTDIAANETGIAADETNIAADEAESPIAGHFLYEPNASVMKAGCFEAVAQRFRLRQLSANSHLFLSTRHIKDFPGRAFVVDAVTTMNKQALKSTLGHLRQANITVRNFPLSVADLRRRLKLGDGGNTYIFATTLADGSHVLIICGKM